MRKIHQKIISWYKNYGRKDLPWRVLHDNFKIYAKDDDLKRLKNIAPFYGVYISEIMLQQTQVKSVLQNYYFQFLEKFPSLTSLANAKEDEVLKAWQGLGYYSRARNLHKSAKICLDKYNAKLPNSVKELKKLPGIGEYSAGAIACFGFLKNEAFVDANIKRFLMRFFALKADIGSKELLLKAKEFLNYENSFEHNQALLDLGALLCTAKSAKCNQCPLFDFCKAKFEYEKFSVKKTIQYENLNLKLAIICKKDKFLIKKSKEKLYHNLYNFLEIENGKNALFLGEFKHSYTKYKITVKLYFLKDDEFVCDECESFNLEELEQIPLSKLSLKALKIFKMRINEI